MGKNKATIYIKNTHTKHAYTFLYNNRFELKCHSPHALLLFTRPAPMWFQSTFYHNCCYYANQRWPIHVADTFFEVPGGSFPAGKIKCGQKLLACTTAQQLYHGKLVQSPQVVPTPWCSLSPGGGEGGGRWGRGTQGYL